MKDNLNDYSSLSLEELTDRNMMIKRKGKLRNSIEKYQNCETQ